MAPKTRQSKAVIRPGKPTHDQLIKTHLVRQIAKKGAIYDVQINYTCGELMAYLLWKAEAEEQLPSQKMQLPKGGYVFLSPQFPLWKEGDEEEDSESPDSPVAMKLGSVHTWRQNIEPPTATAETRFGRVVTQALPRGAPYSHTVKETPGSHTVKKTPGQASSALIGLSTIPPGDKIPFNDSVIVSAPLALGVTLAMKVTDFAGIYLEVTGDDEIMRIYDAYQDHIADIWRMMEAAGIKDFDNFIEAMRKVWADSASEVSKVNIVKAKVLYIIEIKRSHDKIDRDRDATRKEKRQLSYLEEAKRCIRIQASYLFSRPDHDNVVSIAAAGDLWSWSVLTKAQNAYTATEADRDDAEFVPQGNMLDPDESWSNHVTCGTVESLLQWSIVREAINEAIQKV